MKIKLSVTEGTALCAIMSIAEAEAAKYTVCPEETKALITRLRERILEQIKIATDPNRCETCRVKGKGGPELICLICDEGDMYKEKDA